MAAMGHYALCIMTLWALLLHGLHGPMLPNWKPQFNWKICRNPTGNSRPAYLQRAVHSCPGALWAIVLAAASHSVGYAAPQGFMQKTIFGWAHCITSPKYHIHEMAHARPLFSVCCLNYRPLHACLHWLCMSSIGPYIPVSSVY